ncbi:protein NLP5-like isoform X1 [Pyrus x bretschneideri]|uniref:protein NLP5-like isoform X1 n=1 Tax=Pyrus x bretschneideri TaxID=225117 RepID=UPI002030AAE8|nr:protein NLP5-like isoform X1 [Pyrus x bretschneideri]XP_048430820.1 protein NLP5-like isoform X1 [Pyrus x bretschneideri]
MSFGTYWLGDNPESEASAMDDGVLSPATMLGAQPDSATDLDFMDELFLEGCWLETTHGPEFHNQSLPSTAAPLNPSFFWHTLETNGNMAMNTSHSSNQEEMQRPFLKQLVEGPVNPQSPRENMIKDAVAYSGQSVDPTIEGREFSRRWWIGPTGNEGFASSVTERLMRALVNIGEVMRNEDVLVQVWVPVNRGGRHVLTMNDLFYLDSSCSRLAKYRDISAKYQFATGEDSTEMVMGLPGRVFSGKIPEWTPDVRYFRHDEYPRVGHAQQHNVSGTLALPIFEQGSRTCLGVIEVVTTDQKIKYQPDIDSVCKALEAVDLRSSRNLSTQNVKQGCGNPFHAALPEIQEVLRSACETHKLPLAQTWMSCVQQGKDGCRHSDDNYVHCVSTVEHACHVADPCIQSFHEACSEHHLLRGQGIVGRAFMTNQPCFSDDITSFVKTEYPLSHHARMFDLHAAVAIRLRSIDTGSTDFVLEFFLPVECRDPEEQEKMLTSLSLVMQQTCRSLRVVTDKEVEEETNFHVSEVIDRSEPGPSNIACFTEVQQNGKDVSMFPNQKPRKVLSVKLSKLRQHQEDSNLKGGVECGQEFSALGEGSFSSVGVSKTREKRRTKAEKDINLQVLCKYFSGSLKDAAKSIGVCSTTLKRICRQHGIKRWPSRKIKKVGHSLQKLQLVIDSVEGASGAFQINSFYTNFPELTSPNLSGTSPFSSSKLSDQPKQTNLSPKGGVLSPQATASKSPPSSCCQSSSSSQCCSSRTQQCPFSCNIAGNDDPVVGDKSRDSVLKRVRREAGLHAFGQDRAELLPRSQSQKLLCEQRNLQSIPHSLKNNGRVAQESKVQRVKVAYGDEKTRFRMQSNWRHEDLVQEIAKRFSIQDMSTYDIKYLDDDSEWVLLTCDDDLEECVDVCRSSESRTIKLSLQISRHHLRG